MANAGSALHFVVDWGGTRVTFSELRGLSPGAHGAVYPDVEHSGRRISGTVKYENIIFRRGALSLDEYNGLAKITTGEPERRDITVTFLGERDETVMVWKVVSALPIKIELPDPSASGAEVAIESLEIAHEGIEVITTRD
jgi:phage tail-like protein